MPMFHHRQQRRRWAAACLLLLLFGMAAGAVNACGAGLWAVAHHVAHDAAHEATHHAHLAGLADAHAAPEAPSPLAGVHCQDVCVKAASTILPLKSVLDDVHAVALIATAAAIVLPVPAAAPAPSWPQHRARAPTPRIPITLLRLTL